MKKWYSKIFLIVVFLFSQINFGQSISAVEKNVISIKQEIKKENKFLDSLKNELIKNNRKIETKTSSQKLLKISGEISEKIKEKQKIIKSLEESYLQEKNKLYTKIKSKLYDSDLSNEEILTLTQKQIIYSPIVSELKFNPENILEFKGNLKDDFDKKLYFESVTEAIKEVDINVGRISEIHSEIVEIKKLNTLANEFTEEFDFNSDLSTLSSVGNSKNVNLTEIKGEGDRDNIYNEILSENISNLNSIVTQLNIPGINNNISSQNNFSKLGYELTLEDYLSYLNEIKNVLNNYKNLLSKKINEIN